MKPAGITTEPLLNRRVFHYAKPFDYSGIEWGWIHVGLTLTSYDRSVRAMYFHTAVLAGVCMLLGLLASVVYARRLTTPILRLRQMAQRVADGDLEARADVRSGDEVEALASTFNSMTQAVQDREARVRAQHLQLTTLATDKALHAGDLKDVAGRIAEISADTMGVGQVGIWLLVENESALERLALFNSGDQTHTWCHHLTRAGHEPYFAALSAQRTLSVADVYGDPRTACLAEDYFRPMNIMSVLNAGIWVVISIVVPFTSAL